MASNTILNLGSGGDTIDTIDLGTGVKIQRNRLTYGSSTTVTEVTTAAGLPVAQATAANLNMTVGNGAGAAAIPVQGAVASAGTNGQNPVKAGGVFNTTQPTVTDGQVVDIQATARGAMIVATGATKLLVTPDSVALPANQSTNQAQVAGTATDVNNGTVSAGTQRVTIASDSTGLVKLASGANVVGHVIVDTASTTAVTQATGTNLHAVLDANSGVDIGKLTANQSVNVAQINGVTPLMGNGTTGTGSQRVTIASDNTAFAVNNTPAPATSGGLTMFSALLAASNNLTSVKGSAGQVYGIQAFGTGSAPYWLKLYNKASAPVVASDTPVKRILVPANATAANGAGVVVPISDMGLAFSLGIAFACVGLQGDTDATNTAAAGAVNIDYK